jgi:hypothetical protein
MAGSLSDGSGADDALGELITGVYGKIKDFMAGENNRGFSACKSSPK